jgi:two-component system, cell cycle sensor histidine kinase PleC
MKEKLLILDDELLILKSLENLFEDEYEVFTTSDAETALRMAQEQDIAVILCDERMPGISGHEFLRRAREVSNATRVMMSGYADISALTDAVNGGQIFAYIAKPWEPLKLKSQVNAALVHFKLVKEVDQERGLLRALMENSPDLIYFKD